MYIYHYVRKKYTYNGICTTLYAPNASDPAVTTLALPAATTPASLFSDAAAVAAFHGMMYDSIAQKERLRAQAHKIEELEADKGKQSFVDAMSAFYKFR